ncbi:MAG: FtsQ-type POTRA domain-containing protein [Candidatus Hydrogenedentes bacterium]|nr:FtsQ-type POTRA domain-containing protein [Candidatus Hydrogenedentota bacterium]
MIRRRRKRRWFTRALEGFICLGILGGGGYAFYLYMERSASLLVKTIRVEGANVLREEEILVKSGLSREDNLLLLDTEAVTTNILALPYVKTCRVTRVFPDTVNIQIEERVAVATLLVHNRMFELDREGVVLRELPAGSPPTGPFISEAPDLGYVEPGRQLSQRALVAALAVWEAFMTTTMAQEVNVSEIVALHENNVRMYCDELPYTVVWGRSNFVEEARRLDVLWRQVGGELACADYLDLRFDRDLACK